MEQMVNQRTRSISRTTDLELPVALAVPASGGTVSVVAMPVDGVGTFGAWVEQHFVTVGLLGMVMAAGIMVVPSVSLMTVKLGPVLALLSWMIGQELAKGGRGGEADVAGSLALVALAATTVAAVLGAA
jgi:hypothetical protein